MAEDRYKEIAGSASAQASREALSSLTSPEFRQTAAQAMSDPNRQVDPEPEPEETDTDTDPATADEGPSPEAEPAGDDEEVQDDYDPETAVEPEPDEDEAAGADRPTTKTVDAPAASDPDTEYITKTWNAYKTDEERKKALAHNKRYGVTMAEENKRLRSENEVLRSGKPAPAAADPAPTTPAPAPVEDLEAFSRRLYNERADVKEAVDGLGSKRTTIKTRTEGVQKLVEEKGKLETQQQRLTYRIQDLEADLAEDKDNFELAQKIERARRELTRIETQAHAARVQIAAEQAEIRELQAEYKAGVEHFQGFATEEHRKVTEQAKAAADRDEKVKTHEEALDKAFDKLFTEFKIDEDAAVRAKLSEDLLSAMYAHTTLKGEIPDIEAWLRPRLEREAKHAERLRGTATREYVDKKRAHSQTPGPKGAAAVVQPSRQPGRLTAKEADRIASKSMRNLRLS